MNSSNSTLHSQVGALVAYLYNRAARQDYKCGSAKKTRHWKAKGSQQALWQVAGHLSHLCRTYHTPYALYLALQDCLQCLQILVADANEEAQAGPCGKQRTAIERWKAAGAAQTLPGVCRSLSGLLMQFVPGAIMHVLSADGQELVPLVDDGECVCISGISLSKDPCLQWYGGNVKAAASALAQKYATHRAECEIVRNQ